MWQMRLRLKKVLEALFGDGGTRPELRRAAAARAAALSGGALDASEPLPDALAAWVEKVARHAWKITDEDVAALRAAGFDEDAIFEITIAAATGAGLARYQIATRAIEAAKAAPAKSGTGG
jgi:hypothetical protein